MNRLHSLLLALTIAAAALTPWLLVYFWPDWIQAVVAALKTRHGIA